MTKAIFVDTSGWGNLADSTQPFHKAVLQLYLSTPRAGYKFVTTNYILIELVALMTSPLRVPRKEIAEFINAIKQSNAVEIVHIDAELAGWARMAASDEPTGQNMEPDRLRKLRRHADAWPQPSADLGSPLRASRVRSTAWVKRLCVAPPLVKGSR